MKKYFLVFVLLSTITNAQQLIADNNRLDIGMVESALQVVYEFKIYNSTIKQNYILKVDVPKNCSAQIEHKKLGVGDSTTLLVYYNVVKFGSFMENIYVHSANCNEPLTLSILGKIKNVVVDDLQACHPTVKNNKSGITLQPEITNQINGIVIDADTKKSIAGSLVNIDMLSNSKQVKTLPDGLFSFETLQGIATIKAYAEGYSSSQITVNAMHNNSFVELPLTKVIKQFTKENEAKSLPPDSEIAIEVNDNSELSRKLYAPNQVVFLIDKSASMREPHKLPALKLAINCLFKQLRDIDFISIITYHIEANLLFENINADNQDSIFKVIDRLVAKGQTSGGKGIALAYSIAEKHYINDGNNEIVLATDGEFKLTYKDELLIKNCKDIKLKMSVLAFGDEKKALWQLFKLSLKSKGNYMQVKLGNICNVLAENIKSNSKKEN